MNEWFENIVILCFTEMYNSNSVGENMYSSNMSMDGSLENIEDVLINQGPQQNNGSNGPVVNPISLVRKKAFYLYKSWPWSYL